MSEKEKYVIRVLEKLRDIFLNGGVYNIKNAYGYQWSYDEPFSMLEIDALLFLRGANVIDFVEGVNVGDDILCNMDDYRADILPDNDRPINYAKSEMKKGVRITNFDLDKFEKFCEDYLLEPNIERYKIELELNDFYFIIHTTYGKYQIYRDNVEGQPQKIFEYCFKRPGEIISKKELEKECGATSDKSLKSIMRGGKNLDYKNGLLKSFMEVLADRMMVRREVFVRKEELQKIQNLAALID